MMTEANLKSRNFLLVMASILNKQSILNKPHFNTDCLHQLMHSEPQQRLDDGMLSLLASQVKALMFNTAYYCSGEFSGSYHFSKYIIAQR